MKSDIKQFHRYDMAALKFQMHKSTTCELKIELHEFILLDSILHLPMMTMIYRDVTCVKKDGIVKPRLQIAGKQKMIRKNCFQRSVSITILI